MSDDGGRAATAVTREFLRGLPLPQPSKDGDKDQRGRVLVVGGSVEVPGAARASEKERAPLPPAYRATRSAAGVSSRVACSY